MVKLVMLGIKESLDTMSKIADRAMVNEPDADPEQVEQALESVRDLVVAIEQTIAESQEYLVTANTIISKIEKFIETRKANGTWRKEEA